ncbi:hypothetical protein CPAV1605_596 [seawater metagenome]|uniref:Uncharacterized protein n=1 Tax=seawater metagenome TaxID=1561972 RepID=A0A5E8CI54_9ZZZZ
MNYLVEIKKEYTITLVNILTPSIYQGIESIYKESQQLGNEEDILKIFQGLLRRVPKWNQDLIEVEADRILTNSRCNDWLYDLVKAVIKSNIILLSNSSLRKKKNNTINPDFYENISFNDFIHKVYIECAREIWNNPYLFSHDYTPIDIKRNQRDALCLIKEAIQEAIRKMLPVRHILEEYLGNNIIEDDDFESSINEAQSQNVKSLLRKDLEQNIIENKMRRGTQSPVFSHINSEFERKSLTPSRPLVDQEKKNDDNKDEINAIFKPKSTSIRLSTSSDNISRKTDKKTVNKEDIINILRDTHASEDQVKMQFGGNEKKINTELDSILNKDLKNSTDSETSIDYTHGGQLNDDSFEDVFSNVNGTRKSNIEISSIASEIFINNLLDDNNKKNKSSRSHTKETYSTA